MERSRGPDIVAWAFLLVGIALLSCCSGAHAQQPVITQPYLLTSANASSTITTGTGSSFQAIWAAPASNQKRSSCTVQNKSASNNMYVFFGPPANATVATAIQVQPGQAVYCSVNGITLQDAVSINGTSGDAFFAAQQ